MNTIKKRTAVLYIVIACMAWGASCLFVNGLAPFGFSSVQMVSMRGVVAALGMAIYAALRDRTLFKVSGKEIILFALSGFAMFGTASCYYISMQTSSVSTAVILMYTAPIFVLIYSVLFLGEKMTTLKTVSIVGVLVGCCLVSGIVGGLTFSPVGVLTGLASGLCYSTYIILTKIQMRNRSNPVSASMYCFIFMSIVALCAANPPSLVGITMEKPLEIIPWFIALGICTGLLPYFLNTLALRVLPAGTATAMGILEPMSATLYSVVFLHETLSGYSVCGIILILGAVLLLSRGEE